MRSTRVYFAGVVLGATLVAAVWLYTDRAWQTDLHPWWVVLGAYYLPLMGAGVSLWLLPGSRRLIERFFARFARAFSAKPS